MNARWTGVLGAAFLASAATLATGPAPAFAQSPPATTAEDRRQAGKDFADGDRAFKEGDYRQAAESYERAYQRAPHHSALWNAARSWHRAGELARAANLYARYLREAPPGARDRNNAQKALGELSSKLARIEVHATDVSDVKIDTQPVDAPSVFVTPGAHVIEGRTKDDRPVREAHTVEAGDVVSVALVPPGVTPAPAPVPAPAPEPEPPPSSRRWSPIFVYFGGAVTLALAGITVWSGLDTLQQKDAFDKAPSQDSLDVGRQKQTRTNVLIAATGGVAVLTAVAAVFLVDWHPSPHEPDGKDEPRVQLGAGLGTLTLQGEF
ncbi:MAG TPA: tetratricopeptide repeat protein [Polyangiaceae bacterium]|jgi:hypothetical protein